MNQDYLKTQMTSEKDVMNQKDVSTNENDIKRNENDNCTNENRGGKTTAEFS